MDVMDNDYWNHALNEARETARFLGYENVTPGCLMMGLLKTELSGTILENEGITQEAVLSLTPRGDSRIRRRIKVAKDMPFTKTAADIVEQAKISGVELGHPYRGPEHLVMGFGRSTDPEVKRFLGYLGVEGQVLDDSTRNLLGHPPREAA